MMLHPVVIVTYFYM